MVLKSEQFTREKFADTVRELQKVDKGLVAKLKDLLERLINSIKAVVKAYEQLTPSAKSANYLREFSIKAQDELTEMYAEAFLKAGEEYRAQKNTANVESGKGYTIYFSERENTFESKVIVDTINKNINHISPELRFDVNSDSNAFSYTKKSEYVLDIFNKQGNLAYNPEIGYVDLTKSGAKSTISHGYGKVKLAAVKAIKNVIEEGNIISFTENYNDSNADRYIIAAKGKIDGLESYIGVVVKSYAKSETNSKFYLHEAKIIEANSPVLTAPQLSVDTVGESASSNTTITQNSSGVNSNSMQNSKNNSNNSNNQNSLRDTEYLELAKEPEKNKGKLQQMVEEAAKEKGYNVKAYHGTFDDFNVFDISKTSSINAYGKGHYFTSDFNDAKKNYASDKGADVRTKIESLAYDFFAEMGYSEQDAYDNEHADEWNKAYDKAEQYYKAGKVVNTYLKISNPVYIDEYGYYVDNFNNRISEEKVEQGIANGLYDGIIDLFASQRFSNTLAENTTHYVVFEPNQIKYADPVTYDDDGNIIPLSERFNDSENDIRFSSRDNSDIDVDEFDIKDYTTIKLNKKEYSVVSSAISTRFANDYSKERRKINYGDYVYYFIYDKDGITFLERVDIEENYKEVKGLVKRETVANRRSPAIFRDGRHPNSQRFVGSQNGRESNNNDKFFEEKLSEKEKSDRERYYNNGDNDNTQEENGEVKRQLRDDGGFDNRTLLANALETVAQNDVERDYLTRYKEIAGELSDKQKQLGEYRRQIKELSFAKGKRDTDTITVLKNKAEILEGQINRVDKRLLNLKLYFNCEIGATEKVALLF